MQNFSKTLALMSLLAPVGANALGIGDIRLHSALNQSLNAEIPLVTSGRDDISEVRVKLASPEAFSRAGVERHYLLSKLRFKTQQKADGSYVIKVTSDEVIREPFLDFLIEVYWPQGTLQREFTVLLDPPASFQETTLTDEELPETEYVPRPYERPVPRPVPAEPARERHIRPARERRLTPSPAAAPAPAIDVTGRQYGPISRNETLWNIARRFNPDPSISQEQMLLALYRANPQAFYKNSMDALKAGATLTIPDHESVLKLTGASAPRPTVRNAAKLIARQDGRSEPPPPATAEQAKQGQLKLLTPDNDDKSSKGEMPTAGGQSKTAKTREDIALEVADTVKQESEDIRNRLAELEQKLSGMQKLLTLKDQQIAELASPRRPESTQPPQPAKTELSQPPTPSPLQAPDIQASVRAQPSGTPGTSPAATGSTGLAPMPAAKPYLPSTPTAEEEPGFVKKLLDQSSSIVIGGAIGLLLSSALWMFTRRRAATVEETESILNLSGKDRVPLQPKRAATLVATPSTPSGFSEHSSAARSSFLSEFTPSDFEALGGEMEDVDPISEADVYLAYGRYKQAEELIRNAIAQHPERDECKLKLLEIHYSTENAQAFEKFAQELATTHKRSKPDFWEKVVEMGRELCPGSPLFREEKRSAQPVAKDGLLSSETTKAKEESLSFLHRDNDESFEYPVPDIPDKVRDAPEPANRDEPANAGQAKGGVAAFSTVTKLSEPAKEPAPDVDYYDRDNVISFDKLQTSSSSSFREVKDKTLDDIIAELGGSSPENHSGPASKETPTGESMDLSYDIGFEPTIEAAGPDSYLEDHADDYLDLSEMSEQETQLDLAKAYFDMGDAKTARAILEKVAQQGNETQKEEAWSLLNRLPPTEIKRQH